MILSEFATPPTRVATNVTVTCLDYQAAFKTSTRAAALAARMEHLNTEDIVVKNVPTLSSPELLSATL
jgi:hypothetical protein